MQYVTRIIATLHYPLGYRADIVRKAFEDKGGIDIYSDREPTFPNAALDLPRLGFVLKDTLVPDARLLHIVPEARHAPPLFDGVSSLASCHFEATEPRAALRRSKSLRRHGVSGLVSVCIAVEAPSTALSTALQPAHVLERARSTLRERLNPQPSTRPLEHNPQRAAQP